MAGIQGLQLHRVLKGAHDRYRELQDEDWKIEKERRDQIVAQLSGLIPHARTGADIEAINADIAQIMEAPREKQARSKLLKTPSTQVPKPAQTQPQPQPQGAGGATPPPFDFKQLAATLMGGGAPEQLGMPDVPQSAGGPPDSISAVPSMGVGAVPPAGPQPAQPPQMVPPIGAGSLGATGAPTPPVPSLTPPASLPASLPQVQTPPGRSVPEPSPLVGTLPGTPSPVPAGMPAGPQMAPQMQMAGGSATPPPASAALATPPSPSPFMGYIERARLPYELNAEFGMSKTGRALNANARPLVTVKDLVSAADKGLDIVQDPTSPTGFSVIPRAVDDLSYKRRGELSRIGSQIDLDIARTRSLDVRDRLATERPALMRELAAMRNAALERSASRRSSNQLLRNTMFVKTSYDKSVKEFRAMERGLSQLEAMISERTGPGDYGAVIQFVHNLDDTAAREGEVAMARSAASLANRFEQLIEKWKSGDLFADEVRAEFLSAARASNAAFQEHRAEIDQQYGYIADQNGLDRQMVLGGTPGAGAGRGAGSGVGSGAPTPPPVVGATPSSPKAPVSNSAPTTRERWVRDPKTGKLRKAS